LLSVLADKKSILINSHIFLHLNRLVSNYCRRSLLIHSPECYLEGGLFFLVQFVPMFFEIHFIFIYFWLWFDANVLILLSGGSRSKRARVLALSKLNRGIMIRVGILLLFLLNESLLFIIFNILLFDE